MISIARPICKLCRLHLSTPRTSLSLSPWMLVVYMSRRASHFIIPRSLVLLLVSGRTFGQALQHVFRRFEGLDVVDISCVFFGGKWRYQVRLFLEVFLILGSLVVVEAGDLESQTVEKTCGVVFVQLTRLSILRAEFCLPDRLVLHFLSTVGLVCVFLFQSNEFGSEFLLSCQ